MNEPMTYDTFPVAIELSLGDMCLLEFAADQELKACKQAAESGSEGDCGEHARLRCKWYEGIVAALATARRKGEERYHDACDEYELTYRGDTAS